MHFTPYTYLMPDNAVYQGISSLYGPGTILCWYLTVSSCFCSWLFNAKKRSRDSIDNDFVAALTLPVVAATHLIIQTTTFSSSRSPPVSWEDADGNEGMGSPAAFASICPNAQQLTELLSEKSHWNVTASWYPDWHERWVCGPFEMILGDALQKQVAGIEASLNLTETAVAACVVLMLPALYHRCFRRTLLLATVGLFCYAAESYLYYSAAARSFITLNFSRLFLVSFPNLLVAVDALLLVSLFLGVSALTIL